MSLKDFFHKAPNLDKNQARRFMEARTPGSYTLLDVRQPAEYERGHIPGATLIPLPELNYRSGEISKQDPVITYCAIGGRSRAAAQLLKGQGFEEVYNLSGGIAAWDGHQASGPQEWALDLAPEGDEPADWLAMAGRLEYGLGSCYSIMAARTADTQVATLLKELANIEMRHQRHIEKMFDELPPEQRKEKALPDMPESAYMEGGFAIEEFLSRDYARFETGEQVLQLAIALETQALDLYWRLSGRVNDQLTKLIVMKIAGEEQAHLTALGDMLDDISEGQ